MTRGRQIESLDTRGRRLGNRSRFAYSQKKVMLFEMSDSPVEQEWAAMLESWGIGSISVSSKDQLIANLYRSQLIFFDLGRYTSDILNIVSLGSSLPIIPLVAVGSEADAAIKIEILEAGIDDYIDKSYSAREVVARVRAILRRREISTYHYGERLIGEWSMDSISREVRSPDGVRVFLSRVEFDLMKVFIQFPDRIFTADELSMTAFSDNRRRSSAGIAHLIGNIRMKFHGSSICAQVIQTIQHRGYRLVDHLNDLRRT